MGLLKNIFQKKEKEDVHETRRKLMANIQEGMNDSSMEEMRLGAKKQPDNPFFQDIKNKEEYLMRVKVSSTAALMAGDDLDFFEACKEIVKYTDKGLKINPNSAYLLYFRGRSKADLGELENGLKDLNKCLKINPNYADAHVEKGYILQKKGDYSGAKNDYDNGIYLDPSLQKQVNSYLSQGDAKKDLILPTGIKFRFIVSPTLSKNHENALKHIILKQSGLDEVFNCIYVTFSDGYKGNNTYDDKLKGKQMCVQVSCTEPIVSIEKSKEDKFYSGIKKDFSEWAVEGMESNTERKYKAKLDQFLFMHRLD